MRSTDPTFEWPSVFARGDVVRLDDGRIAVVGEIVDDAAEPPARWELIVRTTGELGEMDDTEALDEVHDEVDATAVHAVDETTAEDHRPRPSATPA